MSGPAAMMKLRDLIVDEEIDFDDVEPYELQNLLEKMLDKDPEKRPTIEQII